ncbi:VWA domain-containing protein [Tenacibaculum retecalamus]|uniref:VWA domain-containing protein n=1 Tax=Tenacibaculum retecalamus TaxID=3018315 RepID=UPI0023D96787|nr:VWA domain-containing protein [Tenacibaculum retecalamus]WBX72388.1 VWA domain-containing protein [Tenacibaculum retecalamus]
METRTLIYIIVAVLLSIAVAFFQYFYKTKNNSKINSLLFALKVLSMFLLILLFINPQIETIEKVNIKPVLSLMVDNSLSIKYFKEDKKVAAILKEIKEHKEIQDKFNVQFFSFGTKTAVLDSLSFAETQTDISQAIKSVNELNKNTLNATILISDGNQTTGNDYEYINAKSKIFPIVVGDTTLYQDLQISQLNVNKYSYIKNKFPVEALLHYEGKEKVSATFSISNGGKKVFSKRLQFSPSNPVQTVLTNLTSDKKGIQYYSSAISKIENEKNTKNNYQNFSVEVIDEQTKVLVLSSFLHPDLGAIKKAIESNKQRKVTIALINDKKINYADYQFFVFYQPNNYFKKVFEKIPSNYLVVSGTKTAWNFLNTQKIGVTKEAINQTEDYLGIYNTNFLTFLQKDIGFSEFPPLRDKFGTVQLTGDAQTLLYQKFAGVETTQPLLTTIEKNSKKHAVLFGEGIWKWRAASFLKEQNFETFDIFLGNLVQYLASNKKRKRLDVKSENLYAANSPITMSAFYVDKNYQFDNRASLELTVTNNKTKSKKVLPFSLINNSYQVSVEGLLAGEYSYKVSVTNQKINSYGKFKVTDYQIEAQFTNADDKKMNSLAIKTKGKLFYANETEELLQSLTTDGSYYTVQKSITKKQNLIDWKWILFLVVILFSTEWFIRKYYGKI